MEFFYFFVGRVGVLGGVVGGGVKSITVGVQF
jgi:hypothetical protein